MIKIRSILFALWLISAAFVALLLAPFDRTHVWINWFFAKLLSWGGIRIASLKIEIENEGEIVKNQPCIYVANHQHALDTAIYGKLYPRNTFLIVKKQLMWIPVFGLFLKLAGNIMIDRARGSKAISGLGEAVNAIRKRGISVWIFPEGTRNRTDEIMLPFKKGAFFMAVEAQVPILPIVMQRLKPIVGIQAKWLKPATVHIRVLPAFPTKGLTKEDVPALIDNVRQVMVNAILQMNQS